LLGTIREATVAAQREGWGAQRDPDDLLMTAWSVVHGFAMLWVEGGLQDHFGPIDPEIAASAVIDIVYGADMDEGSAARASTGRRGSARSRSGARRSRSEKSQRRRSNGP
jgi:hypothetical protein